MRFERKSTLLLGASFLAFAVVFGQGGSANASSDNNWEGGTGDWFVPENWSDGVPTSSETVIIGGGPDLQRALIQTPGGEAGDLLIESNALVTVSVNGALDASGTVTVGANATADTFGSTLHIHSGGTAVVDGLLVGATNSEARESNAFVAGAGSSLTVAGTNDYQFIIGGANAATLEISGGAVVNAGTAGDRLVQIGTGVAGQGGTLEIGKGGETSGTLNASGVYLASSDSSVVFNHTDNTTFTPVISGSGSVTKMGSGTLTLTGTNTYSGGTFFNGGVVSVSQDANLGNVAGALTFNGGTLQFGAAFDPNSMRAISLQSGGGTIDTNGNDVKIVRTITGAGSFTKTGDGTLTLSGMNNFTGETIISQGTLALEGQGRLQSSSLVNVNGTLDISGTSGVAVKALTGSGKIALGNSSLRIDGGTNVFSGVISGDGGLTIMGGTQTFTGENTFLGSVGTGVGTQLRIGDGGTTGSIVGNITNYGTVVFNRSNSLTYGGVITGPGALGVMGGGTLVVTGESSFNGGTAIHNSTLQVGNGGTSGRIGYGSVSLFGESTLAFNRSDNSSFSGAISGGGNLRQTGTGTMTLSGDLSGFTGLATASAGILRMQSVTGGNLAVDAGATAEFQLSSGDASYGGAVTGSGTFAKSGGSTLDMTGDISGFMGLTKVTSGTLRLATIPGGNMDVMGTALLNPSADAIFGGALTGFGTFGKEGNATLTITGDHSGFTGVTRIYGGALRYETLPGKNGIDVKSGTGLVFALPGDATYTGPMIGGGIIVKDEASTLTLSGKISGFNGITGVKDGTLRLESLPGGQITAVGPGTVEFALADDTTVSNLINGNGTLLKSGASTLTLDGYLSDFEGTTSVSEGTLRFQSLPAGVIAVGASGTAELALADGTVVSNQITGNGMLVKSGATTLTLAGDIGGFTGMTSVSEGTLTLETLPGGNLDLGASGTLNFAVTEDASFGGVVSGSGLIVKSENSTLTLTGDNSGFTGATRIDDGKLIVNGAFGGPLTIENGAFIGGSGTVGTLTVGTGGTVSPGNSPGTLTVAGDITFEQNSIYEIEIDPLTGAHDLIAVRDNAILNGGTAAHIGLEPGSGYDPAATYTILTASSVNGTFDNVVSDFAFLYPTLEYYGDRVDLTIIRNDVDFAAIGDTPNQQATGGAVEALGPANTLYRNVVSLNADAARDAFDQLSGASNATMRTAILANTDLIRDAATNRVRAAFDSVAAKPVPVMAYGEDQTMTGVETRGSGIAAWGEVLGNWTSMDGNGNAAGFDNSLGGLVAGIDGAIGSDWRIGAMGGYSSTSFSGDDGSGGSTNDYHFGVYGGGEVGALGIRMGAAYTWYEVDSDRSVAFGAFSDQLSASYDANAFQAFAEAGYRIDAGESAFEPYANLAYVNLHTDGYTEQGGAAALSAAASDSDVWFSTIGVRAATDFMLGATNGTARVGLGWRHAYGDTTPLATMAFAGGGAFGISGLPLDEDAAVLEAGVDFALSPMSTLGISYEGQLGSEAQSHTAKLNFAISF
ncbi:autotransporter domain-containing protein [Martelella sp. FOR1707]